MIESKKRGFANITDLGLKEFNENPNLTQNDLMKYPSFVYSKGGKPKVDTSYNELASEVRQIRKDMNDMKIMQSNMNDTLNDTNETAHDIKDTAIDTNETVHDIKEEIKQLSIQLEEIHKDYKKDQQETRRKLDNALSDAEIDKIMSNHTNKCIKKIGTCIKETFGNYKFEEEEKELCNLLKKENWNKLENESKKFLITSKITYKSLNKLPDDIMDYSGVCLLVTKALEVELTKRFCKWFLDYLKGKDYSEYHSSLLNTNNRTGDKYKIKPKNCTLGTITYILGFGGSDNPNEEYEKNFSISIVYSKNRLFKNFSANDEKIRKTLIKYGSYVDKIRLDYRNPAAHTGLLNQTKAEECFEYVLELQKVLKEMLESFDE